MTLEEYNKIYSYPVVKQMQLTFSETGEEDIVLTNADICSEEMSLEESLCSDEDLRFGACEASCFKVRVVNSGSFKGKKLLVEQEMLVDDERYLIDSNGNRIVTSDGKYLIVVPGKADVNIFVGHPGAQGPPDGDMSTHPGARRARVSCVSLEALEEKE